MKIRKLFFRDKQQQAVGVFECWEVRWFSRYSHYSDGTKPEIRVFPIKEDAEEFARALKDAFKLIKHTSGIKVTLKKQGDEE